MQSSITPITISGNHFIKDGKHFNMRGVVYQPLRSTSRFKTPADEDFDPLRNECLDDLRKDIALFLDLGINAIKVYTFLPSLSHDAAFEALAEAGIYVLVGLSNRRQCINRAKPDESYTTELINHCQRNLDCVARYANVIGVVAADHVINNTASTKAAEIIRAVVRDTKTHMRRQHELTGQRIVPVGIADAAWTSQSTDSIDYFTAGDKGEQIDFYSFVHYDQVTESIGHWSEVVKRFDGRSLPIFVSAYGGHLIRPRTFLEATMLYSAAVSRVLSGGFAYEFVEAANRYGLVTADGQKLEDFDNLKKRLQEANETVDEEIRVMADASSIEASSFPPLSDVWRASSVLPAPLLDMD